MTEWSDKSNGEFRVCDIRDRWRMIDLVPVLALREIESAERQAFLERTEEGRKQITEAENARLFISQQHKNWLQFSTLTPEQQQEQQKQEILNNHANDIA